VLLSFTFYNLALHPYAERKIRDEMRRVLGSDDEKGAAITYENVREMTYLKQVLLETLRLYPSVPVDGITATADNVLPGGYCVKKQGTVIYSAYILHRRKDLYPDALCFNPEANWAKAPSRYAFMSFHGGSRRCLGEQMALLEAAIAVVTILRRHTLKLKPGFDMTLKKGIILTSANGMQITRHAPGFGVPSTTEATVTAAAAAAKATTTTAAKAKTKE
jgi:cytochrome P450